MSWRDWFNPAPEETEPEPPEPTERFIRVMPAVGNPHYFDADDHSIHYPGDGRLVIQRNQRREPAVTYGQWHYVHRVIRKPSEVERFRADLDLA